MVVGEAEMPPLEDSVCDQEKSIAGSTKPSEEVGKMYVGNINPKFPPGF